ncbi:hypothetical protein [Winogradskyella rapida]|uniref:Uncharacterized protein n=1 Tax=Winogradskyella rapida TaxID=549701 RepID=A0ABW3KRR7_9FLAO
MAYSIQEQHSRDLDWYFIDGNKKPIHVATGGGKLPKIIEENDEKNENLHAQILQLPIQYEIEINPILNEFVNFENEELRELYLTDFNEMAGRGFISLDKSNLGNFEDGIYHIVAYPKGSIISKGIELNIDEFIANDLIIDTQKNSSLDLLKLFENDK